MSREEATDEQVEKMKNLRKEGKTHEEIADELNLLKSTVSRYLRKEIGKAKITPEIIEEMRSQMRELRNEGMSYEKIAEELDISLETVTEYLEELEKRNREGLDERQINRIKNMGERGVSSRGIARSLGISISEVRKHMNEEDRGFFDKMKEKLGF